MKRNYLILLSLAIQLILNAQQVVTTSGDNMTNNTVQVNWTIGEPILETFSNGNLTVTSGLNQSTIKIETDIEKITSEISIAVFPNPTSQFVNIIYKGQLPIKAKILSYDGTILSITELNEQSSQLDFSKNTSGIYIIEITDIIGKSNTYRIIKQ